MATRLGELVPRDGSTGSDELLGRFLACVEARDLQLYPAQETAILELFEEKNVILNTPTGSGKSLVAAALHFLALTRGRRSVYTCPIKALVNEKWLALCREFGPEQVGLSTGDASVNRDAPILCCTAEILANIALREGAAANVQEVVMDEFHYYADRDRGVAWQVPLLTLPQARFLLMSATLGDTTFFEAELTRANGRPTASVHSTHRPVPLSWSYAETPLATTLETLVAENKSPVYVVHFTQLEAAQSAQDFTSINVCTREEKAALAAALVGVKFTSPYGPEIKKWLRHGIGLHHAGLLPRYRVLVEKLAQQGLLKIICGTDTLGAGINLPIRTVLFTRLCKFDGQKTAILSARDFHQISGRAGRKGFDDRGWVVAQAPEHVVENLQLEQKQARDGKKFVRRKPPERNFVNWDKNTFQRLVAAPPERLVSRFQVSHAMLLNVLSRDSDGCAVLRDLIRRCHEPPAAKQAHTRRAWQLFRSLVGRRIIEFIPPTPQSRAGDGACASPLAGEAGPEQAKRVEGTGEGASASAKGDPSPGPQTTAARPLPRGERQSRKLRVNVELQEDFSMDQALSLYLLETVPLLDPQAPDYALVLLTLVESILEDPDLILRKQLDRVKTEKLAALKADGVPYEERLEELEKLEHPKPNRDFIYTTFNAFADRHPWVGEENIRPKSIAREMFESFRSFGDYVRDYELQRAEGLLLRHLHGVFKVLSQTVPDPAKTEAVREIELYLGTMIRQVDSSLLDEWEKLRHPAYAPVETAAVRPPGAESRAADITRDPAEFTAAVRNRIFTFLRGLVVGDFDAALAALEACSVRADGPAAPDEFGRSGLPGRVGPPRPTEALVQVRDIIDPDGQPWTADRLRRVLTDYQAGHGRLCLDPEARNRRHTYLLPESDAKRWIVQQMLVDPAGHNDWVAEFEVDLARSRDAGEPVLQLRRLGSLV